MKIRPVLLVGSAIVTFLVACSAPEAPPAKANSNVTKGDKNEPADDDGKDKPAGSDTANKPAATGSDAEKKQCFDTCVAGTSSKEYGSCGSKCTDEACGEKCFNDHCGGKEEQCMADTEKCAEQCKLGPSEEEMKCTTDCIGKSVAGPFDTCAMKCENETCEENCWKSNCSGKEEQCDQAIEQCVNQCAPK